MFALDEFGGNARREQAQRNTAAGMNAAACKIQTFYLAVAVRLP